MAPRQHRQLHSFSSHLIVGPYQPVLFFSARLPNTRVPAFLRRKRSSCETQWPRAEVDVHAEVFSRVAHPVPVLTAGVHRLGARWVRSTLYTSSSRTTSRTPDDFVRKCLETIEKCMDSARKMRKKHTERRMHNFPKRKGTPEKTQVDLHWFTNIWRQLEGFLSVRFL